MDKLLKSGMGLTIAALVILAVGAATSFSHSALDRFWGELTVDMLISGDVLIVRPLVVPEDITLTIEPGTVVRFEGSDDGSNAIIVKGRLMAAGTPEQPISFMPRDENSGRYRGIVFEGKGAGVMMHCVVEGATQGVIDPAGRVNSDNLEIK